jgi:polar amino acid transport system substrate-binding protein
MSRKLDRRELLLAASTAGVASALSMTSAEADSPSCPAPALEAVKKRGKLIAGVKTDYEPFGFIDEKGQTVGFDVEISKYIAKKLGVGIDLRPVTSANRIPMLQSGVIDMVVASLTVTRERVSVVDFSVPYIVLGKKFLVKKDSGIKGFAELAGKTVAYTQGTPWDKVLKREQPTAMPLVLQDKPQAVQAVLQGKAAAYIDDAAPLLIFAMRHPNDLEAIGEPTAPGPMSIAIRRNDADWRNTIDFALIDMWEDGTYKKLHKEFLGVDPSENFQIFTWTP